MSTFDRVAAEAMMEEYGYAKHSDCRDLVMAAYQRGAQEKAAKSVSYERAATMFRSQMRSADMWIAQYDRYKDVSGVRNVSLAIGKLFGLYGVLCTLAAYEDMNVEEELIEKMGKYDVIWNSLTTEK